MRGKTRNKAEEGEKHKEGITGIHVTMQQLWEKRHQA